MYYGTEKRHYVHLEAKEGQLQLPFYASGHSAEAIGVTLPQ